MMLNTIREIPVTLQEIKPEAQKDEFMSAPKQDCGQKSTESVHFLVVRQRTIIWWKGGYTQDLTKTDIESLPRGLSRKEQDEESYAELRVLAKNGPGHFQYGWCLQGLCPDSKGAIDYLQAVTKDRLTLVQDSRGFRGTNGGRLQLDCSWQLHKVAGSP